MRYIYLIAAFNAFFFVTLLLQKKEKAQHDNILILWLSYLGLYTGIYAFFPHHSFENTPLIASSFVSLLMLHGPFLYLYVSRLVFKENQLNPKNLVHFAPFLLFNLYLLIAAFVPEVAKGVSLNHTDNNIHPPLLFVFFLLLTVLSGPAYFLLSIKLFRRLDKNISDNFSSLQNIDLNWLRKLVLIFGFIWTVLMIIASMYHVLRLFSMFFCIDGLILSLSVFIILIGYFGLKQREIFIHYPNVNQDYITDTDSSKKYAGSNLKENDAQGYANQLTHYMITEKPYLNPDLTLPLLAKELNIPSYHLSQVINEKFQLNFFDYINNYRIEEVKSRIVDSRFSSYSLLGIAYECGFNSKSTFNRIFKKVTGLTPTEYKKNSQDQTN